MNARVLPLLPALALCALPYLAAQTTVWTGAVDHDFANAANWTSGFPAAGAQALVPAGAPRAEWLIGAHAVMDFELVVEDTLVVSLQDAQLALAAKLVNAGHLEVGGTPAGLWSIQDSLLNYGSVSVLATALVAAAGHAVNFGTWRTESHMQVFGTWLNAGLHELVGGTAQNVGLWENDALTFLATDLHNLGGGVLRNGGTWQVAPAGALTNYGDVAQQGLWFNYGLVLHSGNSWAAAPGATTRNEELWTNQKAMSVQGTWINGQCATFIAEPGSSLTLAGAGTFTNEGILFVLPPGAVVEVTQQHGFTSPDLAWGPAPQASCVPPFELPLDGANLATLTPDDIDAGSQADYCGIATRTLSQTTFSCADAGPQIVVLTVTDSLGHSASCTTVVTIVDTVPPQLACPADTTFQLGPGACAVTYAFELTAADNCTYTLVQTDSTGLASGDAFPVGQHLLSFTADDGFNQTSCSFVVTVLEHQPATQVLVCNDQLNLSIGADCLVELTADMILEGSDYRCYDNYLVEIEGLPGPFLTADAVGQSFVVTVTDPATGNTCWSTVLLEDKQPPAIEGCDTLTLYCVQDPRPLSAGGEAAEPTFSDCSGVASVFFFDQTTTFDCDTTWHRLIHRQWIAKDNRGFVDTCTQVIRIASLSLLNAAIACPDDLAIECDPSAADDSTHPSTTGYPYLLLDGQAYPLRPDEPLCNWGVTYEDVVFPLCGAGKKIVRTWKVYDWCLPIGTATNPWTCTQIIKVEDTTPPQLDLPDTLWVGTHGQACSSQPQLPPLSFTDCSGVTVQIQTPVGTIDGNGGLLPAPGLPAGTHALTYIATDACGHTATRTLTLVVADDDEPVAVCDQFTVVSLTNDGTAVLEAHSIDDGSVDNCCISHFEIRRMHDPCGLPANTAFGPYVTFCCADLGQPQAVVMRVWDCHGNYNECMVTVHVQDKLPPQLTCPPDLTLACGSDPLDLDLAGRIQTDAALLGPHDGFAFDNCSELEVTFSDQGELSCGEGTISRTWTVTDAGGNEASCVQTLTFENSTPYDGSGIEWPADATVYGCDAAIDPAATGVPVLPPSTPCRQLVAGMNDLVLGSTADACLKVLRTWMVIDWCQYDPDDPASSGIWTHTQIIKVVDDEAPVLSGCTDRSFCNFKSDCSDIGVDLTVEATDACTPDSLLVLSWEVDLHADGLPDTGPALTGVGQNFTTPYPLGTHRITYTATDGCGNATTCSFLFTIEDCKKPSPVCAGGLAVELMQSGQVSVPASLLVASAADNCSAYDELQFSFSPDTDDTLRLFDCTQLGAQQVQLWVTDAAGNQDYCQTVVVIQDNMDVCGVPLIAIGGLIADPAGHAVEDVVVELSGNDFFTQTTDASGHYLFADMMAGYDYTVTPWLDADPLEGVTTYDIVLLARHIQGVQTLDSPYKLIAADVDRSGHISVGDMLELRQLILYTLPTFTNNTSWRFIATDYVFPQPDNPFVEPLPEVVNWNNLDVDQMHSDFVAVKIGDLNGDALASGLTATEDRNGEVVSLLLDSGSASRLPKGEEVCVVLRLAEAARLAAVQFTLEWDASALQLEACMPGNVASAQHFGLAHAEQGRLTVSWDAATAVVAEGEAILARLTFRARRPIELDGAWRLSQQLTPARAWQHDGRALPLSLKWDRPSTRLALEAVPNPFGRQVRIYFELPQKMEARLTVTDPAGRVWWQRGGTREAGRHEWRLRERDLPGPGLYFLRLETPQGTLLRKLVRTQ